MDSIWEGNGKAFIYTLIGAVSYVGFITALANIGVLGNKLSRKITHIGTGIIYMLFWPLFNESPRAKWICALVPFLVTLHFLGVGLGVIQDPSLVAGVTRTGKRTELLRGPLLYGLIHSAFTVIFWRSSPDGIMALAVLCGGDGLADIVGRRMSPGRRGKLPHNPDKSYAGSVAFFLGGLAAVPLLQGFSDQGFFGGRGLGWGKIVQGSCWCSLLGAAVESLPIVDLDNLTVTVAVAALARWFYGF